MASERRPIARAYDAFLGKELRDTTSAAKHFEVFSQMAGKLDDLLAEQEGGVATQFERSVQLDSRRVEQSLGNARATSAVGRSRRAGNPISAAGHGHGGDERSGQCAL